MQIDPDITERYKLARCDDYESVIRAINENKNRIRELEKILTDWRHPGLRDCIKLKLAELELSPPLASILFGLTIGVVLNVANLLLRPFPEPWLWTSLFLIPCVVLAVISPAIWLTIRYGSDEAKDPITYVRDRQARLQKNIEPVEKMISELSINLGQLVNEKFRIECAVDEQQTRNVHAKERLYLINKNWDSLSGREFEEFLVDLYKLNGYQVTLTPESNDQGADLIVEANGIRTCVQAKRWSAKVGNKAVQEAYTAMSYYNCERSAVVTTSQFTKSAITLARSVSCELIDRVKLRAMIIGDHEAILEAVSSKLASAKVYHHSENSSDEVVIALDDSGKYIPEVPLTENRTGEQPACDDLQSGNEDCNLSVPDVPGNFCVPPKVLEKRKNHAVKEYPNDYRMQKYELDEQTEAYRSLHE